MEKNMVADLLQYQKELNSKARVFISLCNSLQLYEFFNEVKSYCNYLDESVAHYFHQKITIRQKVILDFEADTITKTTVFTKVACPKGFKLHCFQIVNKNREAKKVVPERPIEVAKPIKRVAKNYLRRCACLYVESYGSQKQ